MGKKSKKKQREQEARKFQGPKPQNGKTSESEESTNGANTIPGSDWKRAEIAYNADGNIIILDPEVASRVRMAARVDRELEIGIPREPVGYTPDPDPLGGARTAGGTIKRNELCVCDFLRFHLEVEGPIDHKLLSNQPRT